MKIRVTDTASKQLKEMIRKSDQAQKKFRILLTGIGWGGPRFGIALDEQNKNDINFSTNELQFLIDQTLADKIDAFTVDYKNFFLNKGFQVYPDGYTSSGC